MKRRPTLSRLARMTRSGIIRYPRELRASIRRDSGGLGHRLTPAESEEVLALAERSELAALWIGHATVLLRMGGRWILTDPVFSERVGVRLGGYTLGLGRLTPPALAPEVLPALDLVLVSHAHFDHLDAPTLRTLARERTTLVTAAKTRRLVPRGFGAVYELGWDQQIDVAGLRIGAMRPEHWGARAALDRARGYNSYVVEAARRRVLFAGDTAETHAFRGVGPLDLAIFGIGGYEPWEHAHATPEQVWRMASEAGATHILPVHHSTFPQSDEPPGEPMERLLRAAGTTGSRDAEVRTAPRIIEAAPGDLWTLEAFRPAR